MNDLDLGAMSIEELRLLNNKVVEMIKAKRNIEALHKIKEFGVGDRVKVDHPKLVGTELTIVKVNRVKVKVKATLTGAIYSVPTSMLQHA